MDFENYKKTKIPTSGTCPKCEKHFPRLRMHANSCLKNDFEKYLDTDFNSTKESNDQTISLDQSETTQNKTVKVKDDLKENEITRIKEPPKKREKKVKEAQIEAKNDFEKYLDTDFNSTKELNDQSEATQNNKTMKTKEDSKESTKKREKKVKEAQVEAKKEEQTEENSQIVSKIKIDDKSINESDAINSKEKFQELYESVIQGLKNQTISNSSYQYRFDFVKLTLDVKVLEPNCKETTPDCDYDNILQPIENKSSNNILKQPLTNIKITPVVLVTNFDSNCVEIELLFKFLFNLFGVYGDVLKIKMIDKKLCFIEFSNDEQAERALKYLDKCQVMGREIRVHPSCHQTITIPTETNKRQDYTVRDFSNSPIHRYRFRKPDSFNYIYPPSATLHISNIPTDIRDTDIKFLFERVGFVKSYRFDQRNNTRAQVQMASVEEGIKALMMNHGKQFFKNSYLRCNFNGRNLI